MTALYRVWQPDRGERASSVPPIEADDADDAVKKTHALAWESGDEQVYCVQRVRILRPPPSGAGWRGEKVRVVRSLREVVPVFTISDPVEPVRLRARCPGCGRRMLDLGELERDRCRRCSMRAYAKMQETVQR